MVGGEANVREMEVRLPEEKAGGEVGGFGRRKPGGEVAGFQLAFPLHLLQHLHGYERSMHCCRRKKRKLPDMAPCSVTITILNIPPAVDCKSKGKGLSLSPNNVFN